MGIFDADSWASALHVVYNFVVATDAGVKLLKQIKKQPPAPPQTPQAPNITYNITNHITVYKDADEPKLPIDVVPQQIQALPLSRQKKKRRPKAKRKK